MLTPANLLGAGAIALWAFLALLSRAAPGLPPLQLAAMSFAVSGLAGLAWLAVRGGLGQLRQPALAWLHGVGGLFGYHALYFAAINRAPPATANLLNYTWPLLVVLLSAALLGLRLTGRHWVGVLLALAGCAVLLAGDAAFPPGAATGYALAVAASVTWAGYSVTSRWFPGVPVGAVAGFCAGAAVLGGALHSLTGAWMALGAWDWAVVLLMGLGPVGIAFAWWDVGMKRGDPRLLGTLAFSTPVLSTLLLAAAGQAPFTVATVVAAVLVAGGGVLAARA